MLAEGGLRAAEYAHRALATIYFGGGTPSLWGAAGVGAVLQAAKTWFPRRADRIEVTLEVNPSEATPELLAAYRAVGVNRVSLGLQTLSDTALTALNRNHTAQEGLRALDHTLSAGFESVSADLMFGLPDQSVAEWCSDLDRVAGSGVPHVSLYHLTLEGKTGLTRAVSRGEVQLPTEDAETEQWEAIEPILGRHGLARYEISSYGRPGHASWHNAGYWLGQAYLGLGAGAHSFRPPREGWLGLDVTAARRENIRPHAEYIAVAGRGQDPVGTVESVDRDSHLRERMFTGLRYAPGIDLMALGRELGLDVRGQHLTAIERLCTEGLAEEVDGRLRLTPRGVTLGDLVAARF